MIERMNEEKYIKASRKLKKFDFEIASEDFSVKLCDFKFLEYDSKSKKRQLLRREHAHSFYEAQFIVRGSNTYMIDDKEIEIDEGKFIFFPMFVKHRLVHHTEEFSKIAICFTIAFDEKSEFLFLERGLEKCSFCSGDIDSSFFEPIKSVFETVDSFTSPVICKKAIGWQIQSVILSLLYYCFGSPDDENGDNQDVNIIPDEQFFNTVKEYMESNLTSKEIMSELSRELFICPRQIRRRLKESCGMTPIELFDRIKCEKIKELLLAGDTIDRICEKVGYSEPSSLIRFFKRMEGTTPAQYRDQLTILNYR